MIRSTVQKLLSFITVFGRLKNINAALFFSKYVKNYSLPSDQKFYWRKKRLVFPNQNISFNKSEIEIFHRSLKNIANTVRSYKIEKEENGGLFLHVGNNSIQLKIKIDFFDSINALNEIFIEQLYYFHTEKEFVVMDVGMNVGIASLYFASNHKVKKVYGYEPFPVTFEMALNNFKLNSVPSQKIIARNYGLGQVDKTIEVPYSAPGFMGASTTSFFIEEQRATWNLGDRTARVKIKAIEGELRDVIKENEDEPIFLKLDCEGAEFEIIDDLNSKGLLHHISIAIIEWHYMDKFIIIEQLEKAGFLVFTQDRVQGSPMGMIYAVNRKKLI